MGNRCIICTEDDWIKNKGMCVYLHWNGGRDSVEPILRYCKMRGFRAPEKDIYGWARLCQVVSNFFGGDGLSAGIGYNDNLQGNDVGDNGTYIIRDWEIVGRDYDGEEQNEYDPLEFMHCLDRSQPDGQQLGGRLLDALYENGRTIDEIAWSYFYMVQKHPCSERFEPGKEYTPSGPNPNGMRFAVKRRTETALTVTITDKHGSREETLPVYPWKDGRESVIISIDGLTETTITTGE